VHPRVDLQVHRQAHRAGPGHGVSSGINAGLGVQRGAQAQLDHVAHLVERWLREHQHGSIEPCRSQLRPFLDERHAEAVGPGGHRRAGRLDRTVAVAVGLHHGPEPRRCDVLAERGDVVRDRGQVDLGPGGAHA